MVGQFQVENADTESYGLELELTAYATDSLTLSSTLALLESEAVSDNGESVRKGNKTPYSPAVSGYVAADYELPDGTFGLPGKLSLQGNYAYVGERQIDPVNSRELSAYGLMGFQIDYREPQWEIYAFVDNAFNEGYVVSAYSAGVSPGGQSVFGGIPGQPRSFGIGIRVRN